MRILVVEDEFLIAMAYEDVLADHNCVHVGTAGTVGQALQLVERERPQAVILDGNLGGEMSDVIATELERNGIPFLVVTGYERIVGGHPILGRAPRLAKPIDPHVLVRTMASVFC